MRSEDQKFVESVRGTKRISKLTAKRLATIWNVHHPDEEIHSCFCSGQEKTRFHAKFFSWYETYLVNDDPAAES